MVWYNHGKLTLLDPSHTTAPVVGEAPFALLTDRIVPGLMKTTYSINIDTDLDYADITTSGIVATSYIEPGNASSSQLASKTVAVDNANDRAEFDAVDLVYTAIGNGSNDTFDQIVITREQDAGATEGNTLLLAHATVASTTTNGGNITLVWNAEGILQVTA